MHKKKMDNFVSVFTYGNGSFFGKPAGIILSSLMVASVDENRGRAVPN